MSQKIPDTIASFGWTVDDAWAEKKWQFENFVQAHGFVGSVAALAEEQSHHPDISYGWGYAQLRVITHDENALTGKDVALIQAIEKIA